MILYSVFSLVQTFAEMPLDLPEEILCFSFLWMPAVQATPGHASSLTHANLAPPKSVIVNVNDEAKSQVTTFNSDRVFLSL